MISNFFNNQNEIDNFKNPFGFEFIYQVRIWTSTHIFSKETTWNACIEFKNGFTEGQQKFENKDFKQIIVEMENFMNKLKK